MAAIDFWKCNCRFHSPASTPCPCLSACGSFPTQRCSPSSPADSRVHATRGVCIYAFGSQSCATRLGLEGSAPLAAAKRTAHGTSGVRRVSGRPRPRSRSPRRRSLRLRGVSRRDALSAEYSLLASRRAPPRMRRTAPPRVAQLGARPPCVVSSPLMRCVPFALSCAAPPSAMPLSRTGVPAEGASRLADLMRALCAFRPVARLGQRRASGTSRAREPRGVDVFCGASLRQ